ncbi:hypothetical protein GKC56_05430, partial [Neisseriaceae bacterium PsAf]|nr:hypothetical protein [Neisseriaceae bacterium PsAf]
SSRIKQYYAFIIGMGFLGSYGYTEEVLTGDVKLACEAILCLQVSGNVTPQCYPSLTKFHSIYGAEIYSTIARRVEFLLKCPVDPGIVMALKDKGLLNPKGKSITDDFPCDVDFLNNAIMKLDFASCKETELRNIGSVSNNYQSMMKSFNSREKKKEKLAKKNDEQFTEIKMTDRVYYCQGNRTVGTSVFRLEDCNGSQGQRFSCDSGIKYKVPEHCNDIIKDKDGNFYDIKKQRDERNKGIEKAKEQERTGQ